MAHSEVETLPEVLEQPDVYDRNAHRHEKAVAEILDTFHKAFRPFENEQQQYIDVGCGPGGFTKGYLLPRCLPCRRLVAVDKSAAMLRFAAEKYPHPKIDYLPLDISQDVDEFVDRQGQFQRVYSFLTLHWVRDQGRAIRNIENLMAAGGECILLFKTSSHFFHLFAAMMNSPRWEKYSQVLKNLVPESAYLSDVGTLRTYAKELVRYTNLTPLACEVFLPPQELHWNTKTMTGHPCKFYKHENLATAYTVGLRPACPNRYLPCLNSCPEKGAELVGATLFDRLLDLDAKPNPQTVLDRITPFIQPSLLAAE